MIDSHRSRQNTHTQEIKINNTIFLKKVIVFKIRFSVSPGMYALALHPPLPCLLCQAGLEAGPCYSDSQPSLCCSFCRATIPFMGHINSSNLGTVSPQLRISSVFLWPPLSRAEDAQNAAHLPFLGVQKWFWGK